MQPEYINPSDIWGVIKTNMATKYIYEFMSVLILAKKRKMFKIILAYISIAEVCSSWSEKVWMDDLWATVLPTAIYDLNIEMQ